MSLLPSTMRAVWQSAELLIAFHKNKTNEPRESPFFWRPKEAFARLLARPEDQEAVVVVRGTSEADDVTIKMHSDKIVVRRNNESGWSGVLLTNDAIRVRANGAMIRIEADGGVVIERDGEKTQIESTGEMYRFSPEMTVHVSSDGRHMSRDTDDLFVGFTPDGLVTRRK